MDEWKEGVGGRGGGKNFKTSVKHLPVARHELPVSLANGIQTFDLAAPSV